MLGIIAHEPALLQRPFGPILRQRGGIRSTRRNAASGVGAGALGAHRAGVAAIGVGHAAGGEDGETATEFRRANHADRLAIDRACALAAGVSLGLADSSEGHAIGSGVAAYALNADHLLVATAAAVAVGGAGVTPVAATAAAQAILVVPAQAGVADARAAVAIGRADVVGAGEIAARALPARPAGLAGLAGLAGNDAGHGAAEQRSSDAQRGPAVTRAAEAPDNAIERRRVYDRPLSAPGAHWPAHLREIQSDRAPAGVRVPEARGFRTVSAADPFGAATAGALLRLAARAAPGGFARLGVDEAGA